MKIQTADFGEVIIEEKDLINFPDGLYAFEEYKHYVLLNYDTDQKFNPIMCLQNIHSQHPSFTVMDPLYFYPQYNPKISSKDKSKIQCQDEKKLRFLVLAVVKENIYESSVNLKSPIVINSDNKMACQVILEEDDYPMRYPIFSQEKKGE